MNEVPGMETRVSSAGREVVIGRARPTVLIGERINPTGKKRLKESLQAGQMDQVLLEAEWQVRAGADILDVNVGAGGVDEIKMLPKVVAAILETFDIPLCLDSSHPAAIEAALAVYPGKPLINSVSAEEDSLESVLPLVKRAGAAVIGLALDEEGISSDPEKRLAAAQKIVARAEALGIPRSDVIIDCLMLSVAVNKEEGLKTLETIRLVRESLGVNITLGLSNISFGLPDRERINGIFLAAALGQGLTCPIVDVVKIKPFVMAADLVLGRDDYALRYIDYYRKNRKGGLGR
jgi:5-methyltetrahydrofolate--homocysteine methyltransferase